MKNKPTYRTRVQARQARLAESRQAKQLCGAFEEDIAEVCLQTANNYYQSFQQEG